MFPRPLKPEKYHNQFNFKSKNLHDHNKTYFLSSKIVMIMSTSLTDKLLPKNIARFTILE
jgi:hypothetical protein